MSIAEIDTRALNDRVTLDLSAPWVAYWFALLRVLVGFWMLHAGLTKLLFGFSAQGYLKFASQGAITQPIMQAFASGAGLAFVNVMIPVGEFLIGLGLIAGALVRLASFFGAFLLTFFYFTNHGWGHGMANGELWGLLLFATLALMGAGRLWGLDEYLENTEFVKRNSWTRYLLG